MLIKRAFCLLAVWFTPLQSMATQQKASPPVSKASPTVSKYEPTSEQLKLIDARRSFARQFFKSDIEFAFYDSSSVRAGTLHTLNVTKINALFYRTHMGEISDPTQLMTFIKKNRALFQIDDETLLTLKDISKMRQSGAVFFQTYKGLPVFDSTISAEVDGGISYILSRLVPSSRLSLATIKPQITPEKVVEINWGGWLSEGKKFTVGHSKEQGGIKYSYTVPVSRTIVQNGKEVVEKKEAAVNLVVYPQLNSTRLAWCFEDYSAIFDANSGEMIEGRKGPFPVGLSAAIRPSACPYRIY